MHRRTHTLSIVSEGVEDAPEVCFCPVLRSMFLATDDPLPPLSLLPFSPFSLKKLREEMIRAGKEEEGLPLPNPKRGLNARRDR